MVVAVVSEQSVLQGGFVTVPFLSLQWEAVAQGQLQCPRELWRVLGSWIFDTGMVDASFRFEGNKSQ